MVPSTELPTEDNDPPRMTPTWTTIPRRTNSPQGQRLPNGQLPRKDIDPPEDNSPARTYDVLVTTPHKYP